MNNSYSITFINSAMKIYFPPFLLTVFNLLKGISVLESNKNSVDLYYNVCLVFILQPC